MSTHRRARKRSLQPNHQVFPHLEMLDERWPPGEALLSVLFGTALFGWDLFGARSDRLPWAHVTTDTGSITLIRPNTGDDVAVASEGAGETPPDNMSESDIQSTATQETSAHKLQMRESSPAANDLTWEGLQPAMLMGDPARESLSGPGHAGRVRRWLAPEHSKNASAAVSGQNLAAPPLTKSIVSAAVLSAKVIASAHPALTSTVASPDQAVRPEQTLSAADRKQIKDAFEAQPIRFEVNAGQFDARVDFVARTAQSVVFLRASEAVQTIVPQHAAAGVSAVVLRMQVDGGNPAAVATGREPLRVMTNYYPGTDPSRWREGVVSYAKVEYRDVYPRVDLVYRSGLQELEYDFVIAPGGNPAVIGLTFAGADGLSIDQQGNLVVQTAAGDVVHTAPYVYQDAGGVRQQIPGAFVIAGGMPAVGYVDGVVRFSVGTYDHSRPLVIDPPFKYSTYLGGESGDGAPANDTGNAIGIDGDGNAWVTGKTTSIDFPTTAGAFDTVFGGDLDAFVAKLSLDANGTADLLYSTYLGAASIDQYESLAVDSSGNVYVAGNTTGVTRPIQNAPQSTTGGNGDAWVAKLDSTGGIAYATYLGGSESDKAFSIAVDGSGNAYVTGHTASPDFPSASGTYAGGDHDVFAVKLSSATTPAIAWSRYFGGTGDEAGFGIALDTNNLVYVVGSTSSANLPTTSGAVQSGLLGTSDAFAAKFNPVATNDLAYTTYVGGSGLEVALGVAADGNGIAYITGQTTSENFPTTSGAFDTTYGNPPPSSTAAPNGNADVFVVKLGATGTNLLYSTYLGGSGTDNNTEEFVKERGRAIRVDPSGCVSVYGLTNSTDFPTTANTGTDYFGSTTFMGGTHDAFVVKLKLNGNGTSDLVFARFIGGTGSEHAGSLVLASDGDMVLGGTTNSNDFPTTTGAYDTANTGTDRDVFVARFGVPPCQ